ncbi:AAA family ATPase [uncultured Maribacter sp.]|uniref:AAA family ATPase n=1 Tax=uncultured Maribacter sp. TaxID=431308 RepID=UPI00343010BD
MIIHLIEQLEQTNTDTILDLGFSKLRHHETFRKFASKNGYELIAHFLDIPKETRLQRILKRNTKKRVTLEFEVSKENFSFMEAWFEKPLASEIHGGILITK